jgi:hypothetical protein
LWYGAFLVLLTDVAEEPDCTLTPVITLSFNCVVVSMSIVTKIGNLLADLIFCQLSNEFVAFVKLNISLNF